MDTQSKEIKIACPHCGQHLVIDASMLGAELECPTCKQPIVAMSSGEETEAVAHRGSLFRKKAANRLKSGLFSGWKLIKRTFLLLPERVQGAAIASAAFLFGIAVFSGNGESRNSKPEASPEPVASTVAKSVQRPDIKPLSADSNAPRWIRSCEGCDYRDVMRFPKRYEGKPMFIQGKISRVYPTTNHRGSVLINQDGDWNRKWSVVYDDEHTILPDGNLLEDDEVCVFGTFEKIWEWTGKNALNATISGKDPQIMARLISADDPDDVIKSYAEEDEEQEENDENAEEAEDNDDSRSVREPTSAEKTFKEGLGALRGENEQERDIAKAYRLFEQAEKEGCILGEVGVAHICWTMADADRQALKKAGVTPKTLYIVNWRHAAEIGRSRIAKCELGLFQLQRKAYRSEGLKLVKEAAAEGSDTAKMFLAKVSEQNNRSSLSYDTILGMFAENNELMALFQQACELELEKEFLQTLKCP